MNKSFTNKNINNLASEELNWQQIQSEMKNKLGLEIYESWLKKYHSLRNIIIIYFYLFLPDLSETGLLQGI